MAKHEKPEELGPYEAAQHELDGRHSPEDDVAFLIYQENGSEVVEWRRPDADFDMRENVQRGVDESYFEGVSDEEE